MTVNLFKTTLRQLPKFYPGTNYDLCKKTYYDFCKRLIKRGKKWATISDRSNLIFWILFTSKISNQRKSKKSIVNWSKSLTDFTKICFQKIWVSFLLIKSDAIWLDPTDQVDFCMLSKLLNGLTYFVSSSIVNNSWLASANWMLSRSWYFSLVVPKYVLWGWKPH